MAKPAKLGDLLEEARVRKGLSKVAAAKALKTTPVTYRNWLRGQTPEWDRLTIFIKFTDKPERVIVAAIRNQATGLQLVWPVRGVASPETYFDFAL